jgi:pyruvate formate lyase activating enzyme
MKYEIFLDLWNDFPYFVKRGKTMNKNELSGVIFNIQRFSLHDGAGIRTLVFMKGCPLRCRWCSNPEGLHREVQILNDPAKCIGCGVCIEICPQKAVKAGEGCPIDRQKCAGCGVCAQYCPANAKTVSGEIKTVDDVLNIVERDRPFYGKSEGGITIGGGEMLAQGEFVLETLKRCKEKGINTAIETSGCGSWELLSGIARYCDTIYFDIKALDSSRHQYLTGVRNGLILRNLEKLDRSLPDISPKPALILRLPLIEGYTLTNDFIEKTAAYIGKTLRNYRQVELLPFHNFGEQKYQKLNIPYEFEGKPNSKPEEMDKYAAFFAEKGIPATVSKW